MIGMRHVTGVCSGEGRLVPELSARDAEADQAVQVRIQERLSMLALPHLAKAICTLSRQVSRIENKLRNVMFPLKIH